MRRIKQTYGVVTSESAEQGDYTDNGWIDEEGAEIAPDEFDLDDYGNEFCAVVELAVKHILQHGMVEPSSSAYHAGVWYTTIDSDKDYTTGEETQYAFHLDGFSDNEQIAIYKAISNRYVLTQPDNMLY